MEQKNTRVKPNHSEHLCRMDFKENTYTQNCYKCDTRNSDYTVIYNNKRNRV